MWAARFHTATGRQVAKSLGLADEEVRVIGTLMGGGFGGKEDIAGQIHAALGAQVTTGPARSRFSTAGTRA